MSAPLPPECEGFAPSLVELALGVLAGEERLRAVSHVEACGDCSALVAELSAAADELLHLAPGVEPPVGFEERVFERLGLKPLARGRPAPGWLSGRRARLAGLVAALSIVVAGAFAGGVFAGHGLSTGPSTRQDLETVALHTGGRAVGKVMVYAGNPTWVFVYMDDSDWSGELRCQVVEDQGPVLTIGKFWLSGGRGAWAASVPEPAGRLREARVVDSQGHVLAVAQLS
jgi:hypothetical protein